MRILNQLFEEIVEPFVLNEELSDEPPKKFSRIIATLAGKDEFLFTFYSEHVLWEQQPGLKTVGVRPYGDGHHIVFVYDPAFIEGLSKESIYFLLGHEVYHILQDHHASELDYAKSHGNKVRHKLANIAQDVWINTDLYNEKTLGGFTMEPPFDSYGFRAGGKWGDVEAWVNDIIQQVTGINPGEKYDGVKIWDSLYEWVLEMFKKYNIGEDDGDDDGPSSPNYPQPGMIIRNSDGTYGQVIEVDETTKKVKKIEVLSKDEAYERARNM